MNANVEKYMEMIKVGFECSLCGEVEWVSDRYDLTEGWTEFAYEPYSGNYRTTYRTICPKCSKEIFGTMSKLRKKES